MELKDNRYHDLVHNFCQDLVTHKFPQEKRYFNTVWKVMSSLIDKLKGTPPEQWLLKSRGGPGLGKLGIIGENTELVTPIIIAVITASMVHILDRGLDKPEEKILETLETIERYSEKFGLKHKPKEILKSSFPSLLKDLVNSLPNKKRPLIDGPEGEFTAEEVDRHDFLFIDEVEINWKSGSCFVVINDEEIYAFRSKEALFAMLCFLAAARKIGDGWLNRTIDLLDPKGQRTGKLRHIFNLLQLNGIPKGYGGNILKADNFGRIRLALEQKNILVDRQLAGFRSRYHNRTEMALIMCEEQLKVFEKNKEKRELRLLLRFITKLHHPFLTYDNNMKFLKRSMDFLGYHLENYAEYKEIRNREHRLKSLVQDYADEHRDWVVNI